jgi:hypothetical protein
MIVDTSTFAIPSSDDDQKKIAAVFQDLSNQLIKCEAIKEYVKEAKKEIKDQYDIPLSVINRVFKIFHENNAKDFFDEQRDIESFYETLFGDDSDE